MKVTMIWSAAVGLALAAVTNAQQVETPTEPAASPKSPSVSTATSIQYVPQQLLGLLHAPEVHKELGLTSQQINALEANFFRTDGDWFRARNLPEKQQRENISRLEQQYKQWLKTSLRPEQFTRLNQLEMRAQGVRMLLRPDVISHLTIDPTQQADLIARFEASNAAAAKLQQAKMQNKVTDDLQSVAQAAVKAEEDALKSVLRPEQLKKLST
jgi:hypothetical protein